MWTVLDCVTSEHDLRFVVVAAAICLFGCFAAVSLLSRASGQSGRARFAWLTGAAFVGGGGIWSTHFVAMLAYRSAVPVSYNVEMTILSIAIAIGVIWSGFWLALAGRGWAVAGGFIAGLAVASMHFTGMFAVRGPMSLHWEGGYVVASIVIGILGGMGALRIATGGQPSFRRRLGAASVFALGIAGLHFTAMTAVTLVPDPLVFAPGLTVDPEALAVAVTAVTVLIIGLGLTGSIVDQHLADRSIREAERLRAYVLRLEETKRELEKTTENLTYALEEAAASSQSKSQFLAAMSHELRTPLNAVIGFSNMIADESFGPVGNGQYIEFARTIADSGNHLLDLINDILDLSSLDAGALGLQEEEVDLSGIVREALRMVANQADVAQVSLRVELPDDLPYVFADRRRLRQVAINLLSNAVKFTQTGGEVQVSGALGPEGLSMVVTDTGIGIAPEDIPRVLERFGQVDNSLSRRHNGSGLGLPLSRDLIELHGGTLELTSTVGVGTSVKITLPESRIVDTPSRSAVA